MTEIEIIPAIMPKSLEDLNEKYSRVKDFVNIVQIDVMDGKFVSSVSWPYNEIQNSRSKNSFLAETKVFPRAMKKEETHLLHRKARRTEVRPWLERIIIAPLDFDFEIDLMVSSPETEVERWIKAGAKRVIVHIESVNNIEDVFLKIPSNIEVGIAINTNTANEKIYPLVEKIDFVQFMGIEKIGFQGQKFDERVINKIIDLRNKFSRIIISVDGGVDLNTAVSLIKAGADRLVSGSVIFESSDIEKTIKSLKRRSFLG